IFLSRRLEDPFVSFPHRARGCPQVHLPDGHFAGLLQCQSPGCTPPGFGCTGHAGAGCLSQLRPHETPIAAAAAWHTTTCKILAPVPQNRRPIPAVPAAHAPVKAMKAMSQTTFGPTA